MKIDRSNRAAILNVVAVVAATGISGIAAAASFGNHAYFLTQQASVPSSFPGLVPSSSKSFCKNQTQLGCGFNILSGGTGDYDVGISGPSGAKFPLALAFVTPYGSNNKLWCAPDNTTGVREIFCGTDSRLSVRYISNTTDTGRGASHFANYAAYAVINFAGAISGFASAQNYNSFNATGGKNSVSRRGEGLYTVTFGGIAAKMAEFPTRPPVIHVQGDIHGQDTSFAAGLCAVESFAANASNSADLDVRVRCFNGKAAARDNNFAIVVEIPSDDVFAMALSDRSAPSASGYFPQAAFPSLVLHVAPRTDSSGNPVTGKYVINISGVPNTGNVQLTAMSTHADYCNIDTWGADGSGGVKINASCYRLGTSGTSNATSVNAKFFIGYYAPF